MMKNMVKICCLMMMGLMLASSQAKAATYEIDPSHTTIGFAVKHLVVSTTRGNFTDYAASFEYDPDDLSAFKADVDIHVSSIDTNNEDRDTHLLGPDFFDQEKFPKITFKNATLTKDADGQMTIAGDLTIRDVTKKVYVPVEIAGPVQSPFGFSAIGITGEVTVNRQDYGVSWNKALDQGGFMVDDMVRLVVEIEAHSKSAEK